MGAIYKHDIISYLEKYKLVNYIETGTGMGECLSHALNFNFNKFYSVEIHPEIFRQAKLKFQNKVNCEILFGNSYEVLPEVLKNNPANTLFFLDAHFPGADFGYTSYDSEKDYDTRLPLEKELKTIVEHKNITNDVFIIDDLRIYEDGPFEGGNWTERYRLGGTNIDFITDLFSDTHDIIKTYQDQGYIILTPKKYD